MRNKILIAMIALVLCAFMGSLAVAHGAATLGNPTTVTANGVVYNKYTFTYGGGAQVMFTGEYKPTEQSEYEFVVHDVRNASGMTVLTTVKKIAEDYEQQTGNKVVLATNGDYFFNTGACVDSLVKNGVVVQKGSYATKNAFGFDNNGGFAIGRMTETKRSIQVTVKDKTYTFDIDKVNQAPTNEGEIALYTTESKVTVQGAGKYKFMTDSVNLLSFPVYGSSIRMATGAVADDKAFSLVSGEFAIVIKGAGEKSQFFFDNVKYGVKVALVDTPSGAFTGMQYVVGGYDALIKNGTVVANPHTDNSGNANAPRTFIGNKADGTVMLGVIDGRQSGKVGVTVKGEADIAKTLGLVNALELDGGGSSTFLFDSGNGLQLLNSPSDGSERKVSNAVLLVKKPQAEEEPGDNPGENPGENPGGSEQKPSSGGCGGSLCGGTLIAFAALAVVLTKQNKKGSLK